MSSPKGNREKFLDLVSKEKNDSSKKNKQRIAKRTELREARRISLEILLKGDIKNKI